MKKLLFAIVALLCVACSNEDEKQDVKLTKTFTFDVAHVYGTRGSLQGDGGMMTDLWLFDYVDGQLVQTIHQTSDDEKFGTPSISLTYGSHHVYFVASRGDSPVVNTDNHTITWNIVRDSFWSDETIDVDASVQTNRSVLLDRVVTRLRVLVDDEVPATLATINLHIDTWYYGLDYVTGEASSAGVRDSEFTIPESLHGTTGQLSISVYGFSDEDIWTTNLSMVAKASDNRVLGQATISNAPFKRNRITIYEGNLFNSAGGIDVGLNTEWTQEFTGQW